MLSRKIGLLCTSVAGLVLLSACGQSDEPAAAPDTATDVTSEVASEELPDGMTIEQLVEMRHETLEEVGDALKTTSDQLKSGSPDMAVIQTATASIIEKTVGMENWFPAGSGPDDGYDTDALAVIWDDKPDFLKKVKDMQVAAAALHNAAQGGDAAAVMEALKTTGGTCKSCHDKYRKDD